MSGARLGLVLEALAQQDHPEFEVVAVGSRAQLSTLTDGPLRDLVKRVETDDPNPSVRANLGIAAAAGELVAFPGDGAVPEPRWLSHLAACFDIEATQVAYGFATTLDGLTRDARLFAWNRTGSFHHIEAERGEPFTLEPPAGRGIVGSAPGLAARRDALAEIGGFDPAIPSDLARLDISIRLRRSGGVAGFAPDAVVHPRPTSFHLADARRQGAACAGFLRRHCPHDRMEAAALAHWAQMDAQWIAAMYSGALQADTVHMLRRSYRRGWKDGLARVVLGFPALPRAGEGLRPFPTVAGPGTRYRRGWIWQKGQLMHEARTDREGGTRVSVHLAAPLPLRRRTCLTGDGIWLTTGGALSPMRLLNGCERLSERRGPPIGPETVRPDAP